MCSIDFQIMIFITILIFLPSRREWKNGEKRQILETWKEIKRNVGQNSE